MTRTVFIPPPYKELAEALACVIRKKKRIGKKEIIAALLNHCSVTLPCPELTTSDYVSAEAYEIPENATDGLEQLMEALRFLKGTDSAMGSNHSFQIAKPGLGDAPLYDQQCYTIWQAGTTNAPFPNLLRVHYYLPCLLYTSPSPRDGLLSRMPSSA